MTQNPTAPELQPPSTSSRLLVPLLIFAVCWTLTTHGKYSVSGDEPHYLMVSQSLWADGDLDLSNNYRDDDGRLFGAAGLEVGQHATRTRTGALLPSHDIGVALTVLPAYAIARALSTLPADAVLRRFRMTRGLFTYSLISLSVIALMSAAGAMTRDVLVSEGASSAVAAAAVIVVWLSPPVLSNSFLVFPEPFALFATVFALHVALVPGRGPFRTRVILLAGVLGLLPWFHRKYAVYSAALLWAALWPRRSEVLALDRRGRLLALSVYLVPQALLAAWTWHHWGNLGGPLTMMELPPFSWDAFRSGSLGIFVDRENGLLVWSPLCLLLPAGFATAGRRYLFWLVPAGTLLLMSAAHQRWWGGFSPAARFLVPAMPIVAVIGAVACRRPLVHRLCLALLVPQVFIAADGWQHARSLWPQGDGHNRILSDLVGAIGSSETLLPSLRTSPHTLGKAAALLIGVLLVNVVVAVAARGTGRGSRFEAQGPGFRR